MLGPAANTDMYSISGKTCYASNRPHIHSKTSQRQCNQPALVKVRFFTMGNIFMSAIRYSAYRVCYYANWSQFRSPGGRFTPKDIDGSLCSHIIFAYADLDGNSLTPLEANDEDL